MGHKHTTKKDQGSRAKGLGNKRRIDPTSYLSAGRLLVVVVVVVVVVVMQLLQLSTAAVRPCCVRLLCGLLACCGVLVEVVMEQMHQPSLVGDGKRFALLDRKQKPRGGLRFDRSIDRSRINCDQKAQTILKAGSASSFAFLSLIQGLGPPLCLFARRERSRRAKAAAKKKKARMRLLASALCCVLSIKGANAAWPSCFLAACGGAGGVLPCCLQSSSANACMELAGTKTPHPHHHTTTHKTMFGQSSSSSGSGAASSASAAGGGGGGGGGAGAAPGGQHMRHLTGKAQPWVERYRPHGIEDIAHQDEAIKTLKNAIQTVSACVCVRVSSWGFRAPWW